ncbi:hypothetical protein [Nostoc sp. CCY0012]|uniref:hypothetical protein n=1 Tax=Nostoc sp. CCY0012 TaxID=1056123 RepID=UPI0039C5E3F1
MLKTENQIKICYATLAIGYEYNQLAKQLAQDIYRLSPNTFFVILTDRPKLFRENKHVIAVKHNVQSVGIFHDKLCCIERCFQDFDCCIFLDADCRLIENLVVSRNWKPGLTAKTCWSLTKHLTSKNSLTNKKELTHKLVKEIAEELEILIDQCKFIYEGVFIIRKNNGKEIEFMKIWQQIRDYLEINGIFDGEGIAMGLAACKTSMEIYHYVSGYPEENVDHDIQDVYKDKISYKLLIHKNAENLSTALQEKILKFDGERREITNLSLQDKLIKKVTNSILKKLRLIKLKMRSMEKRNFSDFI